MEEALSAPVLITMNEELAPLIAEWATLPAMAVDTEADSLYSYYEKVCLVQISVPGTDYILDPLSGLDIRPLGALFADPKIESVFHASEYDILSLKRDYGFAFANLFDTMVASRILGWQKVGLASILQERYGVTLDKRFQRANWGQRPLTEELLSYARLDTHYLLGLRDQLKAELVQKQRLAEAQEEFQRLARVEPHGRVFDPDGFWRLDGMRALSPASQAILKELYRWREEQAMVQDRPPFKVMSDAQMLSVAAGAGE